MCVQVNDWLYPSVMRALRDRFGTTFFLVCADDRVNQFKPHCAAADTVLSIREFGPFQIQACKDDPGVVFERARTFEEKYNVTYMRDIIQQDRTISTRYLGFAPNTVFESYSPPPFIDIINHVN